jgi:predicted RNase H-like HicB family nuclease
MRYPIAIESGSNSQAFGVVVPDLPGCFSAGDSLDEALSNAEDAILGWIETMLDQGSEIPIPSNLDTLRATYPEYRDWVWAVVSVDPAALDDTVERVNITLPRRVLYRLDARAKAAGESRSGFIAKMALS